jgi:hypothetical protein
MLGILLEDNTGAIYLVKSQQMALMCGDTSFENFMLWENLP